MPPPNQRMTTLPSVRYADDRPKSIKVVGRPQYVPLYPPPYLSAYPPILTSIKPSAPQLAKTVQIAAASEPVAINNSKKGKYLSTPLGVLNVLLIVI